MSAAKVTFKRREVFDTTCDRCGRRETLNSEDAVWQYITSHESAHARSDLVGPTLVGKVYDVRTAGEWIGLITRAVEYAQRAAMPYISWNGYVYVTADVDFANPVAWSRDVPDLTEAKE